MYEIKRNNEAQLKVRGKPSWLINRYKKAQKRHLKSRYLLSTKGTNAGFTHDKKSSNITSSIVEAKCIYDIHRRPGGGGGKEGHMPPPNFNFFNLE